MGLYVSHLTTLPADQKRSLYVYLLDYGWPDGEYEKIFRQSFQSLARRASETKSIVLASHRGVHFANEVLSYHRVFDVDAEAALPAILITKTHPSYFVETYGDAEPRIPDPANDELLRNDVVLVPLKKLCTTSTDFASITEGIFSDLAKGIELKNFRVGKYDKFHSRVPVASGVRNAFGRFGKAIVLEPNVFGIGVNLKSLMDQSDDR